MAYINDWGKIREKIDKYEWARAVYEPMKQNCDWFVENWHDEVGRRQGWGHNYTCEKCGTGLKFDRERPIGQLCPHCGHVNMGWRANDCWNCNYRGSADGNAYSAAILYRLTGEQKYVDYIKRILRFYLDNYQDLRVWVVHPMYLGRMTGQHLTDDGSVISLITAMTIIRDQLDDDFVARLGEGFFLRQARFLKPFCYYINNIPVWDLCAIATIGLFYKQPDLIEYAFKSEFGLINQVAKGITKDHFWYEGSVHYHFYCISPMTTLYYYALTSGYKADYLDEMGKILKQMYIMPASMAFRNGMLPNPNDGWPFLSLANNAGAYDLADVCFDDSNVYDGRLPMPDHEGRPQVNHGGMQRLLFGVMPEDYDKHPRPALQSRVWEDTNFCRLTKNDLEVFFKYGLIIGAHSHFDIMNMEICAFEDYVCYDISTNGYGSFLFSWQQGTLSHMTVTADQADLPKKGRGRLLEFNADDAHIRAENTDCYPGIDYTRDLRIEGDTLHDEFLCTGRDGKNHTYDYTFYCLGELEYTFAAKPREAFIGRLYDLLTDVREYRTDGDIDLSFEMADKRCRVHIAGEPGTVLYVFDSPAQSADCRRRGLMIRREGAASTDYRVDYTFEKK